ncbi:MAG: glutamate racemase [Oscillospiraceae bacterium]|nr:glutamate racemase [Oscillospiraceae bacterium]
MDRRPIGVFDSGLGGLTAVKELRRVLPGEDILFLGDTARVPYGTRNADTIRQYAREDMAFLLSRGVKYIVAACGTVSSNLSASETGALPVPYTGVILPTAQAAAAATKNGTVGIIGTPATVKSGAFVAALQQIDPAIKAVSQPCPLFVPLVESGYIARDCDVTRKVAEEYLAPIKQSGADTLILGCTHYPIIRDIIADIMGEGVVLIDSGEQTARAVAQQLPRLGLTADRDQADSPTFYVSDKPDNFSALAELFLGEPVSDRVHLVRLTAADAPSK